MNSESVNAIEIRKAVVDEIVYLRTSVIIAGTNRPPEFPGDNDESTIHFGAFLRGAFEKNVCCATFVLTDWFGESSYQLRGMATSPEYRGRGIGARVLEEAERFIVKTTSVRQLWCSARIGAAPFYQNLGWSVISDVYDVPNVGLHRKMCKRISIA